MGSRFAKLLATFFYVGEFPVAPGTLASAVGVLIVACLIDAPIAYVCVMMGVTFLGFISSGPAEKAIGEKDPGSIVIDEVAGIMFSFFAVPLSWPTIIIGFFLFRAFDMFKIYPANKLEQLGGARGIMMDDVLAGIYTNIVLQIAIRLSGVL